MKERQLNKGLKSNQTILHNTMRLLFLLLVFSLPFLRPSLRLMGQNVSLPDLIFVALFVLWLAALAAKKARMRWHPVYFSLAFFFAAMFISALFSNHPHRSFSKLTGTIYLIGLAIVTFNFVDSVQQLRQLCVAWLGGTLLVLAVSILSIALFYADPMNQLLDFTVSHYGAVPVGNYPRIQSTLASASMLCSFLTVSLGLLFIAETADWIGEKTFHIFYYCLILVVLFTISIGLGGIVLLICGWIWILFRIRNPLASKAILTGGVLTALFFLLVSFVSFQSYKSVPYSLELPLVQRLIYPSSRALVWTEAFQTFVENPITGVGIGGEAARVSFQNTDGTTSLLTDAHNVFLSIAAQTGLIGLFALLFLLTSLGREFAWGRTEIGIHRQIQFALGLTFTVGFVYQGLLGSFEDSRHLWVLIGLILSFGQTKAVKISAPRQSNQKYFLPGP